MRQTLLFSATMAPEIKKLTSKFLSNPKEVSVAPPASTAETVELFLTYTDKRGKKKHLEKVLENENIQNAFIFCNRKRDVDSLAQWLKQKNYAARPFHGDMAQNIRQETLDSFKSGDIKILVCSDVAGRGIDVQGVSHVINYDVPFNPDDFVHRIGRTGRAGQKGRAWTIAMKDEGKLVDAVEKRIKKSIEVVDFNETNVSEDEKPTKSDNNKTGNKSKTGSGSNKSKKNPKSHEPVRQSENRKKDLDKNRDFSIDEDDNGESGFGDDIPAFFLSGK